MRILLQTILFWILIWQKNFLFIQLNAILFIIILWHMDVLFLILDILRLFVRCFVNLMELDAFF